MRSRKNISYLFFRAILFLAASYLTGCASMRGTKQTMRLACSTPSCEVFDQHREHLGRAPGLIEVKRSKAAELIFKHGNQEKKVALDSSYRKLDSLAANFIWGLFGLVGIGVDLWTGAAWELKGIPTVVLSQEKTPHTPPKVIAIAPPQIASELVSDVMGEKIVQSLKERYPQAEVLPFEKTVLAFQRRNYTYRQKFDDETSIINTLKDLPHVTHYVESTIILENQNILADVNLRDVYRPEKDESLTLKWPRSSIEKFDFVDKSYVKNKLVESLPNSLGLAYRTYSGSTTFDATPSLNSSYYSLDYIPNSDLIGGRLGISFSNIRPEYEDRFQYNFRWVSDAHLYRSYYKVLQSQIITGNQAHTLKELGTVGFYNFGLGIGPEMGASGSFGYIYFNMIPSFGFYYVDYFGHRKNEVIGNFEFATSIGYLLEIARNWYFRLNASAISGNSNQISHVIKQYTSEPIKDYNLTQMQTYFSIEYYFPELRNRVKKKALDHF